MLVVEEKERVVMKNLELGGMWSIRCTGFDRVDA